MWAGRDTSHTMGIKFYLFVIVVTALATACLGFGFYILGRNHAEKLCQERSLQK